MERERKSKLILVLTILFSMAVLSCNAQRMSDKSNLVRVDSVFNYYFQLFEMEVQRTPPNNENSKFYKEIILESDTIYTLKDLPHARSILANFSGIDLPYSDSSEEMLLTEDVVNTWKSWYNENKSKIYWDEKKQRLKLRK